MNHYSTAPENHLTDRFSIRFWFGEINSRSIEVFRIAFALLLLKTAIYHVFLAKWFYSDQGLIPRRILFDGLVRVHRFSLMDAIGLPWMAVAFFLIWIVILIGILVGFHTRLMVILNFVMLLSIHERNGFILTGADTAMRVFSFWMMFIPLGQYYALDAYRHAQEHRPTQPTAFALPIRMLQLQLIIIYLVTIYLKLLEPIWRNGEALHYVLQLDSILLLPGSWLRQMPDQVLIGLTHFTIFAEIAIPFLLLFPFRKWFIGLAFSLALFLHGGIGLTLAIPDFSLMMLIAYIPHFPPEWTDQIVQGIRNYRSLFKRLYGSTRVLRWFREQSSTSTPTPLPRWKKVLLSLVLIPLMSLVLWWNIVEAAWYGADYGYKKIPDMPSFAENIVWYTGLWQWWDLFAPLPIQYDGFLIIPGHFENGISYDLRTQSAMLPDHELFSRFGPFMRFEKLEENLVRYRDEPILRTWGNYYCHLYNIEQKAVRGTRLATLEIIFVVRNSTAPNEETEGYENDLLWEHWCFDEYAPKNQE